MERTVQTNTETKSRRPSTAFLVALNALIFLALLLCGLMNACAMGRALAIPVTAIFLGVSGLWQALWADFNRRFRIHTVLRCVGFVLPVTLLVLWLLLGGMLLGR